MKPLTLYELADIDELASPLVDNKVSIESPAVQVFTDFTRHTPLIIDSTITASEAQALMKKTHVKLKFVINQSQHFVGIVSQDDLNSQEIMKRLARENINRDELMITDFMRPRAQLKAFDYNELQSVSINEVIEALQNNGQQHCLVVDYTNHKIRGIFSSSDIARKLHLDIDIQKRSSFVQIFEAVHKQKQASVFA